MKNKIISCLGFIGYAFLLLYFTTSVEIHSACDKKYLAFFGEVVMYLEGGISVGSGLAIFLGVVILLIIIPFVVMIKYLKVYSLLKSSKVDSFYAECISKSVKDTSEKNIEKLLSIGKEFGYDGKNEVIKQYKLGKKREELSLPTKEKELLQKIPQKYKLEEKTNNSLLYLVIIALTVVGFILALSRIVGADSDSSLGIGLGIASAVFTIVTILYMIAKQSFKAGIKLLVLTVLLWVLAFACGLTMSFGPDYSKYDDYSSGPKCELCGDKKATRGDYCSDCYKKLKGFQNTWG